MTNFDRSTSDWISAAQDIILKSEIGHRSPGGSTLYLKNVIVHFAVRGGLIDVVVVEDAIGAVAGEMTSPANPTLIAPERFADAVMDAIALVRSKS